MPGWLYVIVELQTQNNIPFVKSGLGFMADVWTNKHLEL